MGQLYYNYTQGVIYMNHDALIATDRLIYQNDGCRIFHYSNAQQDQAIRNVMTEFPLQKIWRLKYEVFEEDALSTEHSGYLIYHLR
jgi:hypothetical protein